MTVEEIADQPVAADALKSATVMALPGSAVRFSQAAERPSSIQRLWPPAADVVPRQPLEPPKAQ